MMRLFFRQIALWTVMLSLLVAMGFSVLSVGLIGIVTSNAIWVFVAFGVLVLWVSLFGMIFDGPPNRYVSEWVDGRRERFFDADAWKRLR